MINAGDSGTTPIAKFFNRMLPSLKPDIFFVGGDIAYATSLGISTFRNLNKYLKN